MPGEIRYIMFNQGEVLEAIKAFHRRNGDPLPGGSVVRFSYGDRSGVRVTIEIAVDDSNVISRTVVERERLAASLILYCKDRRIPLPVDAHKQLRVVGDQICLIVSFNVHAELMAMLIPAF